MKKSLFTTFSHAAGKVSRYGLLAPLLAMLVCACVRNPDGSINYGRTVDNWLAGEGKTAHNAPAEMSLADFLKEAMTPENLSAQQREAWAIGLNGKQVTIVLPDGLGLAPGKFVADYEADSYIKNNIYYERSRKYTGTVNINYNLDTNSDAFQKIIGWPMSAFQKYINSTPDMKLTLLKNALAGRHTTDYYLLECKGRVPVVLSCRDDRFMDDMTFRHELPTTKKALNKVVEDWEFAG